MLDLRSEPPNRKTLSPISLTRFLNRLSLHCYNPDVALLLFPSHGCTPHVFVSFAHQFFQEDLLGPIHHPDQPLWWVQRKVYHHLRMEKLVIPSKPRIVWTYLQDHSFGTLKLIFIMRYISNISLTMSVSHLNFFCSEAEPERLSLTFVLVGLPYLFAHGEHTAKHPCVVTIPARFGGAKAIT